MRCALALAVVLYLLVAAPRAFEQTARLDVGVLLATYAAGQFDEALKPLYTASDEAGRALRLQWSAGAREWIDADPAHTPQRLLAAASFALETENIRAERGDWSTGSGIDEMRQRIETSRMPPQARQEALRDLERRAKTDPAACPSHCVLNWAQDRLVERGAPDEAEHAWVMAAIALAEGVHDYQYLHRFTPAAAQSATRPGPAPVRGLVDRA